MKTKIISTIVFLMLVSTSVFLVSAKTTTRSLDEGSEIINCSDDDMQDVVLTVDDLPELKEIINTLRNPVEKTALQEVIDFVEKEEQITMDELEELFVSYGNLRLLLNGSVDRIPLNLRGLIMVAMCLLPYNLVLKDGTVNGINAPPKRSVSWSLFLGYACVNDPNTGSIYMNGFAFGLTIDNSQQKPQTMNILQNRLTRLYEFFFQLKNQV